MAALSSHSVSFQCIRAPMFCSLASMSMVPAVPCGIMRRGGIIRCSSQSSNISVQESSTTYQFPPDVWEGYDFSPSSTDMEEQLEGRRQELKKEVKSMISHTANDPFQQLDSIDKMQRLGVAYHFEHEIKHILETIYNNGTDFLHCTDLYYTSTWFRLLRQAGHYASADVFNKFRDDEGRFHAYIASDALSMLSLYQASYLCIEGEDIMEEAMSFTTKHLNSMLPHLSPPLALQVQNALKLPLHKSVERIEARRYISYYQQDQSRNETLLEFAKLDFNALQKLYRSEITILSSWWKNLNMKSRLNYPVRDRVVEAYVINNSVFFEPQFSLGRIHLTKLWLIFTLIDDAHDAYGNLDELQLLDQAIQRWNDADLSTLTGPLKHVFLESVNFVKEVEREMKERGHFIGVPYMKKGLQDFAKAQFEEVKYLFSEDLPILEKWFPIALRTVGFDTFVEIAAMHMGELATKEIFDWIGSMPKLLTYTYYITRIVDDTASYKRERDMGVNISTVTCYMKEHGVSELEAVKNLSDMLSNLWKNMNRECLQLDFIPMCLLKAILNLSRTMEVFYIDGQDGFTTPKGRTEEIIMSLIVNPIYD
uniref:(-)-germacrene D synthase-like protein 1 n=1 Tax=Nigella sativa TaxID=555479 RepID=A0A7D5TIY0_NIGSA|nr:(-)-germacrene D synthase-like protein 1 [Nigella sativa]